MQKNKIIITGGAGFVGTNLINLLLKKTKYKIVSIKYAYPVITKGIKNILSKVNSYFDKFENVIKKNKRKPNTF